MRLPDPEQVIAALLALALMITSLHLAWVEPSAFSSYVWVGLGIGWCGLLFVVLWERA